MQSIVTDFHCTWRFYLRIHRFLHFRLSDQDIFAFTVGKGRGHNMSSASVSGQWSRATRGSVDSFFYPPANFPAMVRQGEAQV